MLELVYDNDVTLGGTVHLLEIYLNEEGTEVVAVLLPAKRGLVDACQETWDVAMQAMRRVAPRARPSLLLCDLVGRRYHSLEADPPPPRWQDMRAEDVRGRGLTWALG